MNTVIIYAHPSHKGHCGYLLREVVSKLNSRNESFRVIDLYKDTFDALLQEEQLYTLHAKARMTKKVTQYQKILRSANTYIFIYPIWWNTMPAILKGFFDTVFTPKFAFVYKKFPIIPFKIPVGLLKGKKAFCYVTTAATWWQVYVLGKRYKTIVQNDILGFCGVKTKVYSFHNANSLTVATKKRIARFVSKRLE